MAEVGKISGLVLRDRTYYYRIRIPKDLIGRFGRTEVSVSLRTPNRPGAVDLARIEAGKWGGTFAPASKEAAELAEPQLLAGSKANRTPSKRLTRREMSGLLPVSWTPR